jgi:hypothetical protein
MNRPIFSLIYILIFFGILLLFSLQAGADDHHYSKNKILGFSFSKEAKDHGNETSGLFAAWIFAAANISIVTGIGIKKLRKSIKLPEKSNKKLAKFNKFQLKLLKPLHYILNPIALIFALFHLLLSNCSSSILPELGLLITTVVLATGVCIKFKLLPKKLYSFVFKFHTSILPVSAILIILFSGHMIID